MEHFVEFLKDEVQIMALAFMALVYTLRLVWLHKFIAPKEGTPARGSHKLGIAYAMFNFAMPWTLMSYRQHPIRYVEFVIFHIAIAITITSTVIIPYWPQVMTPGVVLVCKILIGGGLLAGLWRMIRRFSLPEMRIISSMDDYFSIIILNIYLLSGFFGVANNNVWTTIAFFGMTTFFLVYVPFSKISHYLYYPFNKYFVGKHLGHRGVYPKSYQENQFEC